MVDDFLIDTISRRRFFSSLIDVVRRLLLARLMCFSFLCRVRSSLSRKRGVKSVKNCDLMTTNFYDKTVYCSYILRL